MYRDASSFLEQRIAELEAEVLQLRALGGKRRQRRLVATAVVSMIIATHTAIACVATKIQADRLQRDAARRLDGRMSDLTTCTRALSERIRQVEACRNKLGSGSVTPVVWTQSDNE
jgi:hypothetical protein